MCGNSDFASAASDPGDSECIVGKNEAATRKLSPNPRRSGKLTRCSEPIRCGTEYSRIVYLVRIGPLQLRLEVIPDNEARSCALIFFCSSAFCQQSSPEW